MFLRANSSFVNQNFEENADVRGVGGSGSADICGQGGLKCRKFEEVLYGRPLSGSGYT